MHYIKSMDQLEKKAKLTSTILCLILIVATGVVLTIYSVPSVQGTTIKKIGVGVYQDQNCQTSYEHIDWGKIALGTSSNQTIYLRNELNFSAHLSLSALSWVPVYASKYLSLEWNYSGETITPGQVIPVELTLRVSENAVNLTDFNFNIQITANQ